MTQLDGTTSAHFDHDPNLDLPFKPETTEFLQAYRQSREFEYYYNGNLSLIGDVDHLSDIGKRRALWSRSFVGKLFSLNTQAEADALLDPWIKLGAVNREIWTQYWGKSVGDESSVETQARYNACWDQFRQVDIPEEIKRYQGDLEDEDLRSLAYWEIFKLTRRIRESIDLTEGIPRPVSLETIFRTQRIMGRPIHPAGGLEAGVVNKPGIKRIELDGEGHTAFEIEGEDDIIREGDVPDEIWQRWDQIQIGNRVQYLGEDDGTDTLPVETGVIQGFDLLGAGDAMLFGPSVALVGIVVVNDRTQFFECPLVYETRLESEEFTEEDRIVDRKPKPADVTIVDPQTGNATEVLSFGSEEDAMRAVGDEIARKLESKD